MLKNCCNYAKTAVIMLKNCCNYAKNVWHRSTKFGCPSERDLCTAGYVTCQ